jgi:hypothetical protein
LTRVGAVLFRGLLLLLRLLRVAGPAPARAEEELERVHTTTPAVAPPLLDRRRLDGHHGGIDRLGQVREARNHRGRFRSGDLGRGKRGLRIRHPGQSQLHPSGQNHAEDHCAQDQQESGQVTFTVAHDC